VGYSKLEDKQQAQKRTSTADREQGSKKIARVQENSKAEQRMADQLTFEVFLEAKANI